MSNVSDIELVNNKIYQIMSENFVPGNNPGEYWFDHKWVVKEMRGKSLVEALFIQHEALANEYFDDLFDALHPY